MTALVGAAVSALGTLAVAGAGVGAVEGEGEGAVEVVLAVAVAVTVAGVVVSGADAAGLAGFGSLGTTACDAVGDAAPSERAGVAGARALAEFFDAVFRLGFAGDAAFTAVSLGGL